LKLVACDLTVIWLDDSPCNWQGVSC